MEKLLIYATGGFDENVFWLLIPHRFASNSTSGLKTWANRSEFVVIGVMKTLKYSKVGNAARNDKKRQLRCPWRGRSLWLWRITDGRCDHRFVAG